jgi:hypothetical protein
VTREIDIAIHRSRPPQTIGFAILMQTMERPADTKINRLAGLFLACAGVQPS